MKLPTVKPSVRFTIIAVMLLQCWCTPSFADFVDEESQPLAPNGKPIESFESSNNSANDEVPTEPKSVKAPVPHSKDQRSTSTTTVVPPKSGGKSAGAKRRGGSSKSPVHFESIGLKGLREKGMVELSQDVLVTQDDMRLESDFAQVFFDETSHEVTKVVAQGRVRINGIDQNSGEKFRALGDRAVFLNTERTVVLDGNAKLWRGEDSVIRSKKITYEMNTGWIRADRVAGEVQTENRNAEASKNSSNTGKNTEKRK